MAANLSALVEESSILFFNNKCIVIGRAIAIAPYVLNAEIDFDPLSLPLSLRESIYSVELITLSLEMGNEYTGADQATMMINSGRMRL